MIENRNRHFVFITVLIMCRILIQAARQIRSTSVKASYSDGILRIKNNGQDVEAEERRRISIGDEGKRQGDSERIVVKVRHNLGKRRRV